MDNLEYLKKIKKINEEYDNGTYEIIFKKGSCLDYEEIMGQRRVRALEIIAEEFIKHNEHERVKFAYMRLKGIKI